MPGLGGAGQGGCDRVSDPYAEVFFEFVDLRQPAKYAFSVLEGYDGDPVIAVLADADR